MVETNIHYPNREWHHLIDLCAMVGAVVVDLDGIYDPALTRLDTLRERRATMTDSLPQLEAKRTELFRQLAALGDFRRGSITPTSGKCGKPSCHCAKDNDPGHGPNFRLTRRVEGKTVTETFASQATLRKAQHEVDEFHRFQKLCVEIVEVSERICALRPVEDALTSEEKKRPRRSKRRSRAK